MLSTNGSRKGIIVVIASYRYGHLAAHCIESILSQTVKPDSVLFVDDGVGDCLHLPKLYPSVNYLMRDKNLGVVANFQDILFRLPNNHRVMFLGADNWLRDDCIELVSISDADIVTYDIFVTGEKKSEILDRHGNRCNNIYGGHYWDITGGHHGSMLYDVNIAKNVGGYSHNPNKSRSEEDKVLFKKMLKAGAKVEHIHDSLLFYRRHTGNFNPC